MPQYFFLIFLIFITFSSQAKELEADDPLASPRYTVLKGDSLYNIAQDFDLGVDELLMANPGLINAESKFLFAGRTIILPIIHLIPDVSRKGIVVNLAELRLYFFSDNAEPVSFPISIGKDEVTPVGKTKIISKTKNPSWIPPASILEENPNLPKIIFPGPDNPLGNYALYLDASKNHKWQSIMIHGTNAPKSIGSKVSHGCIRLYPQDIEQLFDSVEIDTPVEFVNQPLKVEEIEGKIYIEIHLREAPDLVPEKLGVKKLICRKIADCEQRIDWQKVDDAVVQNLGIPVLINSYRFSE